MTKKERIFYFLVFRVRKKKINMVSCAKKHFSQMIEDAPLRANVFKRYSEVFCETKTRMDEYM